MIGSDFLETLQARLSLFCYSTLIILHHLPSYQVLCHPPIPHIFIFFSTSVLLVLTAIQLSSLVEYIKSYMNLYILLIRILCVYKLSRPCTLRSTTQISYSLMTLYAVTPQQIYTYTKHNLSTISESRQENLLEGWDISRSHMCP